jgi:hypothetical protein
MTTRIVNIAVNVLAGAAVTLILVLLFNASPISPHHTGPTRTIQRDAVFHVDTRVRPVRHV